MSLRSHLALSYIPLLLSSLIRLEVVCAGGTGVFRIQVPGFERLKVSRNVLHTFAMRPHVFSTGAGAFTPETRIPQGLLCLIISPLAQEPTQA